MWRWLIASSTWALTAIVLWRLSISLVLILMVESITRWKKLIWAMSLHDYSENRELGLSVSRRCLCRRLLILTTVSLVIMLAWSLGIVHRGARRCNRVR